jgi:Putative metal-binding motif
MLTTSCAFALAWGCASGTTEDNPGTGGSAAGPSCTASTWYRDSDGDGYGNEEDVEEACEQPAGYIVEGGDCDDTRSFIHPGADEDCATNADYNCDGSSGYQDVDEDGVAACDDCDDSNPTAYPDADEICDGVDNDCDGLVDLDDEPDEELCPTLANATGLCEMEACVFSCETDYFDINQDLSDGCECLGQPAPTNIGDTCETAVDLGNLTDAMADVVTVDGNSPTTARETWFVVSAIDDIDTAGDEYHVDGRFLTNPNGAYVMDVYRDGCPASGGTQIATLEPDSFDWYVDFPITSVGCSGPPPCGEGDCSAIPSDSVNLCEDDSAVYAIRITRTDGLPSCDLYSLELSNGLY